jgi:hypothetical protein
MKCKVFEDEMFEKIFGSKAHKTRCKVCYITQQRNLKFVSRKNVRNPGACIDWMLPNSIGENSWEDSTSKTD